ncbi:MAG TPA: type II 3-dehydroquinate dehydratase [Gemmatimonadaceae bacterium]|nr:type II 3-dehydroquinate dehydratase [Gemmatimonadaceae bacterium]
MNIAVLNGPNLNLLGSREPHLYGTTTLAEVENRLRAVAAELGVSLSCAQHNGEGELVTAIQQLRGKADGVIVNAGAYSHTSLAIRDAFAATALPYVEVHVSNIYAREPERRHSTLADGAMAIIAGLGVAGYELALRGLVEKLRTTSARA